MVALVVLEMGARGTLAFKSSTSSSSRRQSLAQGVAPTAPTSVAEVGSGRVEVVLEDREIERPSVDTRRYRLVRLENGLEALLVSDLDADEAGAAVSVKAGSFDDTRSGIAHFHEHMLFLGTEKYPDEDEYEAFLNAHGGSSNAWTADEETCYYFSVNADALDGSLDRLSQFFVSPLLDAGAVEREVRAVDSEHSMSLNDDGWRLHSVMKTTCDPEHPYARFSTGTLETLLSDHGDATSLLDELRTWNSAKYTADKMRLAVVGRESLDELQSLVTKDGRFGAIPTPRLLGVSPPKGGPGALSSTTSGESSAPARRKRPVPWGPSQVKKLVRVVPVRELRSLQLLWPLPPRSTWQKQTPELLASHVLGHEGPTTLHSKLRALGYVDSLQCGTAVKCEEAQLFELSMELTEVGEAHLSQVLELAWEWVGTVRGASSPDLARTLGELKRLHGARFQYSEKGGAADLASNVADALWDHPLNPVAGPSAVGDFDDVAVRAVLDALTPERCVVVDVRAHDVDESFGVEKWHGASYSTSDLESDVLDAWTAASARRTSGFALPGPNAYVAEDLSLKRDARQRRGVYRLDVPAGLAATTVWRRADYGGAPASVPRVPKVSAIALFRDEAPHSPESLALAKAFVNCVSAQLEAEAYDAWLAGLLVSVDATKRGTGPPARGRFKCTST